MQTMAKIVCINSGNINKNHMAKVLTAAIHDPHSVALYDT